MEKNFTKEGKPTIGYLKELSKINCYDKLKKMFTYKFLFVLVAAVILAMIETVFVFLVTISIYFILGCVIFPPMIIAVTVFKLINFKNQERAMQAIDFIASEIDAKPVMMLNAYPNYNPSTLLALVKNIIKSYNICDVEFIGNEVVAKKFLKLTEKDAKMYISQQSEHGNKAKARIILQLPKTEDFLECVNCGYKFKEDDHFCCSCGTLRPAVRRRV